MRLFNGHNHDVRSSLIGLAAMTLFQLLILFAIGAAVIRYLEWSSDAAQAEFVSAMEAASDPSPSERSILSQPAKERDVCNRKDLGKA
jgi:hypothetical protein